MNAKSTLVGKELAALRKRVKKNCVVCGREIVALKQAKYCSNRCRQRAKYQRQKIVTETDKIDLATALL
jgi:predicted nucleic acid-binding Zn ribbon protein